jgi:Glycosyl Hydrolase Family 88.
MTKINSDMYLYKLMTTEIEEKLRRTASLYTKGFPHVSEKYEYIAEPNNLWTSSFYPGMMFLMYDLTGDDFFLKYTEDYLDSFEERLDKRAHISHDLGFLYTLSSVAPYKLTGNERGKKVAQRAADMLAERYNEDGQYIQAWGEYGVGTPDVRIIIDTMLNLPLLYWSENEKHHEMAIAHARTSAKYLVRDDYTSFHTYWMNPQTGAPVRGATHQGLRDESTWARGQAWTVCGYALSYMYTKEKEFLEVATKAARVFIDNLPEDSVPYWDFNFNDNAPDIRDTSAASIFICGLLELCKWVDEETAEEYRQVVYKMMRSLFDKYFEHNPDTCGVLREAMYHRDGGADAYTSWGDYFFLEALVRLQKDWKLFW